MEAPAVLRILTEQVSSVSAHVENLIQRIRSGAQRTDKGLSFLQLKNQMLSMYLSDMVYVILRKVSGNTLKDESAILRLVEIRTVLEKMRPVNQKLRYQIDKLVKTALTGSLGEDLSPSEAWC
ncbi:neuroguidin-A-like [Heptranchias perlo]|uniref:neuroguidin-A-like n=2 Tax=Heptranchias perlo TaxID=212740 RepID=UPI00355A5066